MKGQCCKQTALNRTEATGTAQRLYKGKAPGITRRITQRAMKRSHNKAHAQESCNKKRLKEHTVGLHGHEDH